MVEGREERQAFWNELRREVLSRGTTTVGVELSLDSINDGDYCYSLIKYRGVQDNIKAECSISAGHRSAHPKCVFLWVKILGNETERTARGEALRTLLSENGFEANVETDAKDFAKVIIYNTHSTISSTKEEDANSTADLLINIESYLHRI